MKKLFLSAMLIICFLKMHSQKWSEWYTVYKDGDESVQGSHIVQVSFSLTTCNKNGLVGYAYYRTRNTKSVANCYLHFSFDYYGCDNKGTVPVMVNLSKTGIDFNRGMHFYGIEVTKVAHNVKLSGACANKMAGKTSKGTDELVFPEGERARYNKVKERLEKKINDLPQTAFKSDFRNRYRDNTKGPDDDLTKAEYERRKTNLEKLEIEVDNEADYQKKAREKNQTLKQQIRSDINSIDAEEQRSSLTAEFEEILEKEKSESELNEELESFHTKVKSVADKVKANKEKFAADKKEQEKQIDDIRTENQEIKKEQAGLIGAYGAAATGILAFKGRQGKGSRYEGPSYKVSIKGGIQGNIQPVGYIEHREGSLIRLSNATILPINEKNFTDDNFMAPGIYLTTELHPYFSNNFSVGFTASASYAYWPEANDGINDASLNYSGNSRSTVLSLSYGAELTVGAKPVKILARFHFYNQQITTGGIRGYTIETSEYQSEYDIHYYTDQKWKMNWAALGLRFGDYNKSRSFLDLAFTRYIPTEVIGKKTVFSNKHMLQNEGYKIPYGVYAQFSQQNGWYVKAEYIKDYMVLNEDVPDLVTSKKSYINLLLGKSLEWFGKPYSRKKHSK